MTLCNPEEDNLYSVLHKELCSLFAHQIVKPSELAVKTILNFLSSKVLIIGLTDSPKNIPTI